jgi:hypothetical protein
MIVDDHVGAIVNQFHVALTDNKSSDTRLRNLSLDLARACRTSLGFNQLS